LSELTFAWLLCAALFVIFVSVGSVVQLANLALGVWFTEVAVFFGVAFVALRAHGRDAWRATGFDSVSPRALGLGFALGLVNYLAWAAPLMAVSQKLFPKKILELFDGSQIFAHQSRPELVLIVLGVGLAAPVCEEYFFRGVFQRSLMTRLEPSAAIVVSALVFSIFHLDPVGFLARFELGVVFGLLAWRSGSVWPGIAAHAANNLFASLLFALADKSKGDDELSWLVVLGLFVGGNVVLIALARFAVGRLAVPRPAENVAIEPVGLLRGAIPWVVVSALAIGAVLALDWRGAVLKVGESATPLPKQRSSPELEALREQARTGQVPFHDYFEARAQAADAGQVNE
jgi:uncharacterized protein